MTYTNANRGLIQYKEKVQHANFSGLKYGNCTPMDLDCFMDLHYKVFILVDFKYAKDLEECPLPPQGQELAIKRMIDTWQKGGVDAYAIYAYHQTPMIEDIEADLAFPKLIYHKGGYLDTECTYLKQLFDAIIKKHGVQV